MTGSSSIRVRLGLRSAAIALIVVLSGAPRIAGAAFGGDTMRCQPSCPASCASHDCPPACATDGCAKTTPALPSSLPAVVVDRGAAGVVFFAAPEPVLSTPRDTVDHPPRG